MHRTMFDTPVIKGLLHGVSCLFLKLYGWRREGRMPDLPKFVIIGAPHTSNWDGVVMLALAFAFKINLFWMGKSSLFRWPFGGVVKWCGGIPVDRSGSGGVVEQTISIFQKSKQLVIAISPEGTRARVKRWKTGFYYTALGAEVPIVLGFLDYKRKAGGVGPLIYLQGDIKRDMKKIQAFYNGISGKYPAS